jgi:hypothetical protein
MATKRTKMPDLGRAIGSSGAAHSQKFGQKMAPGDSTLPRQLRTVQSQDLANAPKGPRVGPVDNSGPVPPVKAVKRGKRGRPINS